MNYTENMIKAGARVSDTEIEDALCDWFFEYWDISDLKNLPESEINTAGEWDEIENLEVYKLWIARGHTRTELLKKLTEYAAAL